MRAALRSSLAVLVLSSSLGCAAVVGADFDGLTLRPDTTDQGGAAGTSAGEGGAAGASGEGGAPNGGAAGTSGAGKAGSGGIDHGGTAGANTGGNAGTTSAGQGGAGSGGSQVGGSGGTNASGSGGTSTGGQGGGAAGTGGAPPVVPPRVCGDRTGLDEDAPWPMDGVCPTRIGRAAGKLVPLTPTTIPIATASTGNDEITSGAVVDGAGNIYVMTRRISPFAAVLRVFDAKGASLWEFPMPNESPGWPVLTRFDGVPSVLVSTDGQVRLLSRDGEQVLGGVASPGSAISASPVVSGGTVFFTSSLGELHAWRPGGVPSGPDHVRYDDGNTNWARLSPAVGADGTIYFVKVLPDSTGGALHAVTLEQNPLRLTKKWSAPFADYINPLGSARLAVAGDGTIVFATAKALVGFTPQGEAAFSLPIVTTGSSPSVLGDRIFHAGENGTMLCVSTKGKQLYETPAGYGTSFAVTDEGWVTYVTTSPGRFLRTIDGATGTIVAERDTAIFDAFGGALSVDGAGHPVMVGARAVTTYGQP